MCLEKVCKGCGLADTANAPAEDYRWTCFIIAVTSGLLPGKVARPMHYTGLEAPLLEPGV